MKDICHKTYSAGSNACMYAKSLQSCPTLCDPMDYSPLGSSVHGLPCPSPGDLPDPGIKPSSLMSPALGGGPLPLAPPGKPLPSRYSLRIYHH